MQFGGVFIFFFVWFFFTFGGFFFCLFVFFIINYSFGCYLIWVAVIFACSGWSLRLRPRAAGLDWFSIQRQTGNCKSRQCFAWVKAEKTNGLLEVSVLFWSVRVKEEVHKMPGDSRSILHRHSLEKTEIILSSMHFWQWLHIASLSNFSTFLIF